MDKFKQISLQVAEFVKITLAVIGLLVLWTYVEPDESDDSVIIEYNCSEVRKNPRDYPEQAVEECGKNTTTI
jgi:hypothetical protein